MNNLRTLLVDCNLASDHDDFCRYRDETSFLDYDLVIWNPAKIFTSYDYYRNQPLYEGYRHITSIESRDLLNDKRRRGTEIENLMQFERCVVIFIPAPEIASVYTTGNNLPKSVEISSLIPVKYFNNSKASGNNFEFKGGAPLRKFWTPISHLFQYKNYFSDLKEEDFLFIKGTTTSVGRILQSGEGHVVCLPTLRPNLSSDEQALVIWSIKQLAIELRGNQNDFILPDWGKALSVPNEDEQLARLMELSEKAQQLEQEIRKQQERLVELESLKALFCGDGDVLEKQAQRVFVELGFDVASGAKGRDDVILKFGEDVAVVEVKGLGKSAAEKNAAQLEKWVVGYYDENQIDPKGILLINAFKDTPLNERNSAAFPHQMLRFCERREHCLMTGLQLLGMYLDIKAYPEKKQELVRSLLETVGVYQGYSDWTLFLTEKSE